VTADLPVRLRDLVGPAGVVTAPDQQASYLVDWRGAYRGRAAAVVRPGSTAEVAAVLRLCAAEGIAVVPQGGNTGLCGGSVPDGSGTQVVLSTDRLRAIRGVDRANRTMTVEAGVVLADAQAAARDAGLLFPLSLGSEGSATIGGNVATNAGGTAVLRYGTMRALTLGLEVVLPDGRIWPGLRGLRKDNTGYDLTGLFVGSEGTLGVVTAAVLRLFPAIRRRATAWVGLPDVAAAVALIDLLQDRVGDRLSAFELMSRESVRTVLDHVPGTRDPLPGQHAWFALVELGDTAAGEPLDDVLAATLDDALDADLVSDAVLATSPAQAAALWRLREGVSEAQNAEGPSLKHDVTVPISCLPEFVVRTGAALADALPGVRLVTYGHVGDGNLHYNLGPPRGSDGGELVARADELSAIVYDSVASFAGSISAEHGLGRAKAAAAARSLDPVELDLMRRLKAALDPAGLMNPGAVLADGQGRSG
jgi:FAD/FMN-containing dehydrogenase